MGYKMNGFSGFGNSPAKQMTKQGEKGNYNSFSKGVESKGTLKVDGKKDNLEKASDEYEKSKNKDNKKNSTKKDDKGEKDTSVRKNVAKAVAGFIASEKRRQARKDEGAQRVAEGIGRAMSRKL